VKDKQTTERSGQSISFLEKILHWKSILYLYFTSLFFAAFAAPAMAHLLVFWDIKAPSRITSYILSKGFRVIYDRIHLFCFACLLLIFGLKAWLAHNPHMPTEAMRNPKYSYFWKFFIVGISLDLVIMLVQVIGFPHTFISWSMKLWGWILWYTMSACFIAILEEGLFRGCLLLSLYRSIGRQGAIWVSSLIFAYAHFYVPRAMDVPMPKVAWNSGFRMMYYHLVGIFWNFETIPFIILLVMGIVLSQLVFLYRSLMPAIGFHAGMVWTLMLYRKCIDVEMPLHPFLGTWRLLDAPMTLCILLFVSCVLCHRARKKRIEVS
jgi:membrane protease YdiL (CAAX protease family)